MIVTQLTRLLSVPPGDLVYHLVVLFAIEAVLLMAVGEGRRSGWPGGALRLTLAASGALVLRGAQVMVALLSIATNANSAWVTPPLERFAAVASLGLLAWAFLPLVDDYAQAGLVLVVINVIGSVILYAFLAPPWYRSAQSAGAFYNATPDNLIWSVWAAALATLSIIAGLLRRRAQWALLVTAFSLFLLGYLLHLIYAEPQTHVAGWVRLAELCAYPLLAGLMIIRAVEREEAVRAAAPVPAITSMPWAVIEGCQRVAEAANVKVALQRAGMAIGNLVGTDVLAIGLLSESGDTVELAAVCRTRSEARSGPVFDIASQSPVYSAVSRQRTLLVSADQEMQHATLAALVGGTTGPLWIQPLVHQRETMGVLIAGLPTRRTASGWNESETQMLDGLCDVLASALSVERRAAALTHQIEELKQRPVESPPAPVESKRPGAQPAPAAPPLLAPLPASTFKRTPSGELLRSARPTESTRPAPAKLPSEGPATRAPQPPSERTLRVRVKVDRDSPLKSARAMMVLTQAKRMGRLIACQPVEADLRSGGFEEEFTVTFATASTPETVQDTLTSIRDVKSVDVQVE
jgi:hypothetical protein